MLRCAHLRKLCKLDQLDTVQLLAINKQEPTSVHIANNTHLPMTRANNNIPLFRGPTLHHINKEIEDNSMS
jgi:hypothetical protein